VSQHRRNKKKPAKTPVSAGIRSVSEFSPAELVRGEAVQQSGTAGAA
jgi:hypothetical protein